MNVLKKIIGILISAIFMLMNGNLGIQLVEAKDETNKFNRIDTYLQEQMKEQAIAGLAYAIVQGEEIVHSKAFGKADFGKPLTANTPMKLASLSKSFTALAIMQLVDQGKVDLDAPLKQYIPWFQLQDEEAAASITIRQLLNQTSGLPSEVVIGNALLNKSLEETVKLMEKVAPLHPAGTKFEYSNLNYISLGLVVENVTGRPLAEYMETHILTPLNMNDSYTSIEEAKKHGLSKDYTSWFGMLLPTKTLLSDLPNFLASGYMVSSAEDMSNYLLMYMNQGTWDGQKVVSKKAIQTLKTPSRMAEMTLNGGYFGHYAMGWWEREVQGDKVIGHSGDLFSAARTDMYILPEKQIGLVILTNTNTGRFAPGDSHISTDGVISLLSGKEPLEDESQSFVYYYLMFDGIVALLLIGLLWYGSRSIKHSKQTNPLTTKWVAIAMILQLSVPPILFLAAPTLLGIPSWSFFYCVQADLVSVILFTMLAFFVIGIVKGTQTAKKAKAIKISK
jgi:CubicO group peptidase (beta-lactamase class C family)